MKQLAHFLLPESILLSLSGEEEETTLEEILKLLRYDSRVSDWQQFSQTIAKQPAFPLYINEEVAVMIYHARTNAVQDLVMAAGRSSQGVIFRGTPIPVPLIFVIGIPHALSNEYLRIMGSIARLCKDEPFLKNLLSLKTPEEFIKLLSH